MKCVVSTGTPPAAFKPQEHEGSTDTAQSNPGAPQANHRNLAHKPRIPAHHITPLGMVVGTEDQAESPCHREGWTRQSLPPPMTNQRERTPRG